MKLSIKKIGEDNYEAEWRTDPTAEKSSYDYHIRKEGESWYVDVFNSLISDKDAAHIDSDNYETFQEVIDFILTDGWRK